MRTAIDLGHNLGLTVVAEGVEGAEHVAALRELGLRHRAGLPLRAAHDRRLGMTICDPRRPRTTRMRS